MALHTVHVYDKSYISTDEPDFSWPDAGQYSYGTSTITIQPGATSQPVTVDDPNDTSFDDDDPEPQTLGGGPYTINGTSYGPGTVIEAEYLLQVQDSLGTSYYIAAVSLTGDPYNIQGFTVHGPLPPMGEPLTVVAGWEGYLNAVPYTSSTPSCFEARTRIAVPGGWREARALRPGDRVSLARGSSAEVALVLHQQARAGPEREARPVRLRADALGRGQPERDLTLSPQHRVWVEALGALVPARALIRLPRIGLLQGRRLIDYVHIVLPQHALLLAEGCPAESFWPGPVALAGLPPRTRGRIRAIMGPAPCPCAPMLAMRPAERALTALPPLTAR
ncbi:Hint domain-containing protein [Oceanicola sp. 502str15]|uniref:Hint domain-containing protein n=1 Tax=Oceanicola sp. 502str15 TaxID=2696061 RepID=UPI00209435B5|nr:Hint domain-containing protein [Oceanicola sp. 502str15]MCO6381181.1 hypothetical protein [Oceanicola sp. 502str15]